MRFPRNSVDLGSNLSFQHGDGLPPTAAIRTYYCLLARPDVMSLDGLMLVGGWLHSGGGGAEEDGRGRLNSTTVVVP